MDLSGEERLSDSPFVELVWRSRSEDAGSFISMAEIHCNLVVTKHRGKTTLTVRGPESTATPAYCPPDAEFMGIVFGPGTFMPDFPPNRVKDRQDVNLPEVKPNAFWLKGEVWEFPNFDNADTFVDWLVRDGLLDHDPLVDEVLQGHPVGMSTRTVQRRFQQATGLTQSALIQIERARYATSLLTQGMSILDTVYAAGYFDQPHLTKSLKYYMGLTPAKIAERDRTERLSFQYKTIPSLLQYDNNIRLLT